MKYIFLKAFIFVIYFFISQYLHQFQLWKKLNESGERRKEWVRERERERKELASISFQSGRGKQGNYSAYKDPGVVILGIDKPCNKITQITGARPKYCSRSISQPESMRARASPRSPAIGNLRQFRQPVHTVVSKTANFPQARNSSQTEGHKYPIKNIN